MRVRVRKHDDKGYLCSEAAGLFNTGLEVGVAFC
jgi:hypothetical protein